MITSTCDNGTRITDGKNKKFNGEKLKVNG